MKTDFTIRQAQQSDAVELKELFQNTVIVINRRDYSQVEVEDFEDAQAAPAREPVTKQDFFALGLSGRPDSAAKRAALLQALSLPAHMSANALLQAVNVLFSREEFLARFVEP